jgi:hypothetical protein
MNNSCHLKGACRGSLFQSFYLHPSHIYACTYVITALTVNYFYDLVTEREREILSGFGLFDETGQPKQQISVDYTVFSNAKKSVLSLGYFL